MVAFRTQLLDGDGLTVPASLRRVLGLTPGDTMVMELHGDELRIRADVSALRRIQESLAPFGPAAGEPLVSDQLIADRRRESESE